MNAVCAVYLIQIPNDERVYIGVSLDVLRRIGEHARVLKRGRHLNSDLQQAYCTWRAMPKPRQKVKLQILENCDGCRDDRYLREAYWQTQYRHRLYEKGARLESRMRRFIPRELRLTFLGEEWDWSVQKMKLTPEEVIELAKMIELEADPKKLQTFATLIDGYAREEMRSALKDEAERMRHLMRDALLSLRSDMQRSHAQIDFLIEELTLPEKVVYGARPGEPGGGR